MTCLRTALALALLSTLAPAQTQPKEALLVVTKQTHALSIVDAATLQVTARIPIGEDPHEVIVAPTHTGKDLLVFDVHTRHILRRIPIEQHGASGIQIEPDGHRAFIACPRDHIVAVVDLRTMQRTATIDAGREPDGLAWWTPNP